ncbi:MAG TPA: ABC transporter permease subunit, partial [Trueperaceae bacterium]|nr:ABC transporter permease subunit [Trueperaceae bacterium]
MSKSATSTRRRNGPAVSAAWFPALLALASLLALPVGRPDRPFLTIDGELYALALGGPLLWALVVATVASLVISFLPLAVARRGDVLLLTGGAAFAALLAWLMVSATPFGVGSLVALVGLTLVLGTALSESGRIQGDPFIAASILFVAAFVLLFIVFPLFTVLRGAIFIDGRFDLSVFAATLKHPLFFVLDNELTPQNELAQALSWSAYGALAGVVVGLLRRSRVAGLLAQIVAGAAVGFVLGIMLYGTGALVTSLAVVLIVAPTCTLLGLAFALLGQRARLKAVRRSLDVISVLPIITPPFILAFAMVFLLGRRGLITYDVLNISSSWIYGIPGVAMAQILAFTPVAYLLLRGSIGSLNPSLEEAAQTLGARPAVTLRTIIWPLLRPGMAAAFLLRM